MRFDSNMKNGEADVTRFNLINIRNVITEIRREIKIGETMLIFERVHAFLFEIQIF